MIYYFSSPNYPELLLKNGVKNVLLSYALEAENIFTFWKEKGATVLVDSGAFSVWNSGEVIDIDKYLAFIQTLPQDWNFVSLDVIPKDSIDPLSCEKASKEGIDNYIYLSLSVPQIMPVYHQGEPLEVLEFYSNRTDYIGISPDNSKNGNEKYNFLQECFSFWYDKKLSGKLLKFHAFGFSNWKQLEFFPFYSVDSTSWKRSMMFKKAGVVNTCESSRFLRDVYFDDKEMKLETLDKDIAFVMEKVNYLTRLWKERGLVF